MGQIKSVVVAVPVQERLELDVNGQTCARMADLVLLTVLAPFIALVAALIALAIYLDSPGPVIFRSQRVGRDGESFEILKFRKMRNGATGHALTLENDERFTPIGRFLAATRLDELPQIWNVLRGEMRLVGPRPELECFVDEFRYEYAEILKTPPGLTGVAQLRFHNEGALLRGADPETAYQQHVLPAKVKIDLEYVRTRSLWRDAAIVARTIVLPLRVVGTRLIESRRVHRWLPATGLVLLVLALFTASSGNVV